MPVTSLAGAGRRWSAPVPVLVLVAGLLAAGLPWAFAVHQARLETRELESLMEASGAATAEALAHAVEDARASAVALEESLVARLIDGARSIASLEDHEAADRHRRDLVRALDLTLVLELAPDGTPEGLAASTTHPPTTGDEAALEGVLEALRTGVSDVAVALPRPGSPHEGSLAVAVRAGDGEVTAVVAASHALEEMRRDHGAAHLLAAVVESPAIVSAALVGPDGEALAEAASPGRSPRTLEVARDVHLEEGRVGRLTLGLSRETVDAAQRAARVHDALLALLLSALVLVAFAVSLAWQRARLARQEARRVRATAETVLASMEDAVVLVGDDAVIRLANAAAARLVGRAREDIEGTACDGRICGPVSCLLGSEGGVREVELEASDGTRRQVLATVSRIASPGGGDLGTAILLRDLTRIRRLERASARAEGLATLGRLAGAVAHEVRNPLNSIAVGAQRLAREFRPLERTADFDRLVRLLREEVQRLDGIVERFLDLGRTPAVAPRPGNLDALVTDLLPLLADGAPAGVRVGAELGGATTATFDGAAVRQVLLNLVRNAVEAVGERGHVTVATGREGDGAWLEVSDDGPGIPPSHRARLFDLGFTTKPHGTGMGLPIVHALVGEMGGRLELVPRDGAGTTVRVVLPAVAPVAAPEPAGVPGACCGPS